MTIERDSVHFRILERLCAMLDRHFGAPADQGPAAEQLIRGRGMSRSGTWSMSAGPVPAGPVM
jgi:hypothetical protein